MWSLDSDLKELGVLVGKRAFNQYSPNILCLVGKRKACNSRMCILYIYRTRIHRTSKKCASLKLKAVGLADLIGMARLWMKRTNKTVFLQSPYCAYFSSHPSNTDLSVSIHN